MSTAPGDDSPDPGLVLISRGTAIMLLFVYLAFLWFQVSWRTIENNYV